MVGLDAALLWRRDQLLLFSPRQPRVPALLGVARGSSFVAPLQPFHGVAPELDGHDHRLDLLDVAAPRGFSPNDGADHAGDQPALSVLDSHGAGAVDGAARVRTEYAIASSRASRVEPALHRPESRRNADHLGPSLWKLRTGGHCGPSAV